MRRRLVNLLPLIVAPMLLRGASKAWSQASQGNRGVFFPNLKFGKDEMVVSFSFNLAGAVFHDIPSIPIGWSLNLDNNADLQPELNASCQVGASAIRGFDFQKFVFGIKPIDLEGLQFAMRLIVYATEDFKKMRVLPANEKDAEFLKSG